MAPARDPDNLGELWQFIQGEFNNLRLQIDSNDKIATTSIARLVDAVRSQDQRLDENDEVVTRYIPQIPEAVKELQQEVQRLKDIQNKAIAGGSVALAIAAFIWPLVKALLKIP